MEEQSGTPFAFQLCQWEVVACLQSSVSRYDRQRHAPVAQGGERQGDPSPFPGQHRTELQPFWAPGV